MRVEDPTADLKKDLQELKEDLRDFIGSGKASAQKVRLGAIAIKKEAAAAAVYQGEDGARYLVDKRRKPRDEDILDSLRAPVAGVQNKRAKVVVDWNKGEAGYPARILQLGVDPLADKIKKDYTFTRNKITIPAWLPDFAEKMAGVGDED